MSNKDNQPSQPVAGELPQNFRTDLATELEREWLAKTIAELRAVPLREGAFQAGYETALDEIEARCGRTAQPVQQPAAVAHNKHCGCPNCCTPAAVVGQEPEPIEHDNEFRILFRDFLQVVEGHDSRYAERRAAVLRRINAWHAEQLKLYTAPVPAAGVQGDDLAVAQADYNHDMGVLASECQPQADITDLEMAKRHITHLRRSLTLARKNYRAATAEPDSGRSGVQGVPLSQMICGHLLMSGKYDPVGAANEADNIVALIQPDSGRDAALVRAIDCLEILNKRQRPMCRDCADEDGKCPSSGLDCDMRKLIADARAALAAHPAPSSDAATMRALIEDAVANHKSPKGYIDLCMQHYAGTGIFAAHPANGAQVGDATQANADRYLFLKSAGFEHGRPRHAGVSPVFKVEFTTSDYGWNEGESDIDKAIDSERAILAAIKKGGA